MTVRKPKVNPLSTIPQKGLVYVEYMLATLVLVVFLFMPVPGAEHSIVEFVLHSIRGFYQGTSYLMALP